MPSYLCSHQSNPTSNVDFSTLKKRELKNINTAFYILLCVYFSPFMLCILFTDFFYVLFTQNTSHRSFHIATHFHTVIINNTLTDLMHKFITLKYVRSCGSKMWFVISFLCNICLSYFLGSHICQTKRKNTN